MYQFKRVLFRLAILGSLSLCLFYSKQDREGALKASVEFITADSLLGRKTGSNGEKVVANYIYDVLEHSGVEMISPRDGDDFFMALKNRDTIHSRNVIGIVPGYDSLLKNEYIVIGAHIDHLGHNILDDNGKEVTQIYSGADDNASGVATMLEIAKKVAQNKFLLKRSVIFAAFGAEEVGMAGSWYFLNRAFKDKDKIKLMINLDMVGRSGSSNILSAYTVTNNTNITRLLKETSDKSGYLNPPIHANSYFPSDHLSFYENEIPVVLFTSGVHRDYHTHRDTKDKLDYSQMYHLTEYTYSFTEALANSSDNFQPLSSVREGINQKGEKESIYTQFSVDKRAEFLKGDIDKFLTDWVYKYIKYPDSAVRDGISGRVQVEFVVGSNGAVRDVKIKKGLDDAIDQEVIKVISASPRWKPARISGEDVSVQISILVDFKLKKRD